MMYKGESSAGRIGNKSRSKKCLTENHALHSYHYGQKVREIFFQEARRSTRQLWDSTRIPYTTSGDLNIPIVQKSQSWANTFPYYSSKVNLSASLKNT